MTRSEREEIEINSLLEAIFKTYGYDFRHYSKASLKRRLQIFLEKSHLENYVQLSDCLIHNKEMFYQLLLQFSITVTEMFRDPEFYQAFRKHVVPILKTYPFIKIWHAGCATGEEVYSMAILLYEEDFLHKTTLYATDFNVESLKIAKKGIYRATDFKQYINNYNQFGGKNSFSDYYHASYGSVKINDFLKNRITFSHHNLVTDQVFGEMNVIICRNVMIYFDRLLQDRVVTLFKNSLCHHGFLCIGTKETLDFTVVKNNFSEICLREKIYQRNI